MPRNPETAISVIIPSRLAKNTVNGERLFIEDAIDSIRRQVSIDQSRVQIVVGIDAGATTLAPTGLTGSLGIELAESAGRSQATALNAAVDRAAGDVFAFLEDDDFWDPTFLSTALDALTDAEFVSSNHAYVNPRGEVQRVGDFPTPGGWVMPRATFHAIGRFDESYRWHLDNDWLGRLGDSGRSRIHLVESTAPVAIDGLKTKRRRLHNALRFGGPSVRLLRHAGPSPLVLRRAHAGSGMQNIARNAALQAESNAEIARLMRKYGLVPW